MYGIAQHLLMRDGVGGACFSNQYRATVYCSDVCGSFALPLLLVKPWVHKRRDGEQTDANSRVKVLHHTAACAVDGGVNGDPLDLEGSTELTLGSDGQRVPLGTASSEEEHLGGDGVDEPLDGVDALGASPSARPATLAEADRNEASSDARSDAWRLLLDGAPCAANGAGSRHVGAKGEGSLDASDSVTGGAPSSVKRQRFVWDARRRSAPGDWLMVYDGVYESLAWHRADGRRGQPRMAVSALITMSAPY